MKLFPGTGTSNAWCLFWLQKPALYLAVHLLIGAGFSLYSHPIYLLPLSLLWLPFLFKKTFYFKIFLGLCVVLLGLLYAEMRYPSNPSFASTSETDAKNCRAEKKQFGEAYFSISSLKPFQSPFSRSYVYQGMIKEFVSKDTKQLYLRLPCIIFINEKNHLFPANHDYLIEGKLIQKGTYNYLLKPKKKTPWKSIKKTQSLAQIRFHLKEKMRSYLNTAINDSKVASFLSALITADVNDRTISLEMKKVGLQHLLAVSGFHFGLIALFLTYLLRIFLPLKFSLFLLILMLCLYFGFVGPSASVMRGWICICFFLIAKLLHLRCSGLNLLGVALIIEILFDPLIVLNMGFQLSFLCTFGILLLFQPIERALFVLLPKRSLNQVLELSFFQQHITLICLWIRKLCSLNLSVHLLSIPLLLFLFHKFPLISLIYNLFFPFCANISMFLLLLALFFSPIPLIAHYLHQVNTTFTSFSLNLVSNTPLLFNKNLHVSAFSFSLAIFLLTVLIALGIGLHLWNDEKNARN